MFPSRSSLVPVSFQTCSRPSPGNLLPEAAERVWGRGRPEGN